MEPNDTGAREPATQDIPDPLVGRTLASRFRILRLIARGGMGKIYQAEQLPLGRTIALKVLAPMNLREDEEDAFRKRFEREASISARLTHSNTVRVFDYGWTDDHVYFIAMEFIDGRTLHQIVKSDAPMPPLRVIHVARQICGSLSEAHRQGIVHRDLKPGNVLMTPQNDDPDFVKVVDFGLVKNVADSEVTHAGQIVGSPVYMSPEQVRGANVDHRTDIYSLGMMMYVMLSGKRPFERDSAVSTMFARVNEKAPRMVELNPAVKVPPNLEWTVMTALQQHPKDRFESMSEMLRALRVCEAEARGDGLGSVLLSLDQGRTVLPPDFSDVSLISAPRPVVAAAPAPSLASRALIVSIAVAGLGLSLVGIGALAMSWALGGRSSTDPADPSTTTEVTTDAPQGDLPAGDPPAEAGAASADAPPATEGTVAPSGAADAAPIAPADAAAPAVAPTTSGAGSNPPAHLVQPPPPKPKPKPAPASAAPQDSKSAPAAPQPAAPQKEETWHGRPSDIRNPFDK